MTDLFVPGDERAGSLFSGAALLAALVRVEQAWLSGLVGAGLAPASAELAEVVTDRDVEAVAAGAEAGGNPVIPLVELLRTRLRERGDDDAAQWLHRGLTSQDVVDTALMLLALDALAVLDQHLARQIGALAAMTDRYRAAPMAGRTLTQFAVPITFGLKAAGWLTGVLDARAELTEVRRGLPAQFGGAAGTRAAAVELAAAAGDSDPVGTAQALATSVATSLGLRPSVPWHAHRRPVTRLGDAVVTALDAWGRLAGDVLVLARPEIAELGESAGAGRGGSSTMPHKQNPILSTLIRRAALSAPLLGAHLHLAAGQAVDERSPGAWHAEWPALRTGVMAASQATELIDGLTVDTGAMRRRADAAGSELLAEQQAIRQAASAPCPEGGVAGYLGAADAIVAEVLDRVRDAAP